MTFDSLLATCDHLYYTVRYICFKQYDYVFDWTMLKQKAAAAASATSANPSSGAPKQLEKTKSKGKI